MAPRESTPSTSRGYILPTSMQVLTPVRAAPKPLPKMSLPIELLEQVVEYMPVQTQLRFAQTSRAMRDMIYEDTRWVVKLKAMGVWDEEEARRAAEEELEVRRETARRAKEEAVLGRTVTSDTRTTTLFDATVEKKKIAAALVTPIKTTEDLLDFQFDNSEAFGEFQGVSPISSGKEIDGTYLSNVLSSVVSRRGQARSEFGKVYAKLAHLYIDLANSTSPEDAAIFRHRQQPEEQAQLLRVMELFGRARAVDDWRRRQKRITWITKTFERQMLTNFEKYDYFCIADVRAYVEQDIDGNMKKYALVLNELNGGESCMQLFVQKHPTIFLEKENPMTCLTYALLRSKLI